MLRTILELTVYVALLTYKVLLDGVTLVKNNRKGSEKPGSLERSRNPGDTKCVKVKRFINIANFVFGEKV